MSERHDDAYEAHLARVKARQAEMIARGAECGPLPKVVDPERRAACRGDLHRFLATYFPHSTGKQPFSEDHRRIIPSIQNVILEGGRRINCVYRGFAKTTISQNSCIWAVAYGHRHCVTLFGADQPAADRNMESIKFELETNALLYDDFPEICHAIRHLEGKPQKAKSQTFDGERTYIRWRKDYVMLPTIPGSEASAAIIVSRGLTGASRGFVAKLPSGENARPDLSIVDDPQTDQSGASPGQVKTRIGLLLRSILKMAGHQNTLACVVNGTPIAEDDLIETLLDPAKSPSWEGERIPMVKKWADAHDSFWLGAYANVRNTFDRGVPGDRQRAIREATELYRRKRAEADAGADVSWEHCFDPQVEISALQHAANMLIDDGPEAFAFECQVSPKQAPQDRKILITPDQLARRTVGLPRGRVPPDTHCAVAMIDIQDEILFYAILAVNQGFTGAIVQYGTWPQLAARYFNKWQLGGWCKLSNAFFDRYPHLKEQAEFTEGGRRKAPLEAKIYFALQHLVGELLALELPRDDDRGLTLRLSKIGIDCRWGKISDVSKRFIRDVRRPELMPYLGRGIKPEQRQMEEYTRTPGWLFEDQVHPGMGQCKWIWRPGPDGQFYLDADVNRLKSALFERLSCPLGSDGAIALHRAERGAHDMFADHVAGSEYPDEKKGKGRLKEMWEQRENRDNDWLDCLTGCLALASFCGARLRTSSNDITVGAPRRRKLSDVWAAKHGS